MTDRKLFKCFDIRFLAMVAVAALVVIAAAWVGKRFPHGSVARLVVAIVQGAAMSYAIVTSVMAVRRLDELQYRIHLEAMTGAFAATAVLITTWGFLEKAGVPAPRWGLWAWPVMVALWGCSLLVLGRRYR